MGQTEAMEQALRPCPTCGAPIGAGRLSCASCGTLLASVSGRHDLPAVRWPRADQHEDSAQPAQAHEDPPPEVPATPRPAAADVDFERPRDASVSPDNPRDAFGGTGEPAGSPRDAFRDPRDRAGDPRDAVASPRDVFGSPRDRAESPPSATWGAVASAASPRDGSVDWPSRPPGPAFPAQPAPPVPQPVAEPDDGWDPREAWPARAATPVPAYTSVPAAAVGQGVLGPNEWYSERAAAMAARTSPAGAGGGAPAAAFAGATGSFDVDRALIGTPLAGQVGAADAAPTRRPSVGLLSDVPFDAPQTTAAWLAAAGAFISGGAVILPWRAVPDLPYLTLWGAANSAVVIAAILALVVGLVTITPSRLSGRVRWGYLPFFLGAFGVGAAWMWVSTIAPDFGVWVYVAGSILAMAGGALSLSGQAEPTAG